MPDRTVEWFANFASVPGVGYSGDLARRRGLPESCEVPRVRTHHFASRTSVSLSWGRDGYSSASPVHRRAFGDFRGETGAETRERMLDALELPGTITDYHFLLQGAASQLYARREDHPALLPLVEWAAALDVSLVGTHRELFRVSPDSEHYISITSLDLLLRIYTREGYLLDALELAERMHLFMRTETLVELRERVTQARSEG